MEAGGREKGDVVAALDEQVGGGDEGGNVPQVCARRDDDAGDAADATYAGAVTSSWRTWVGRLS